MKKLREQIYTRSLMVPLLQRTVTTEKEKSAQIAITLPEVLLGQMTECCRADARW
jgi:hypothetical protein